MVAVEEQFRRAAFNVMARNQDDHVKNIAFLMDRSGNWSLSPAYDVAYAYNPSGAWTRDHQMSLAGRRNDFERDDILRFAAAIGIRSRKALETYSDEGWRFGSELARSRRGGRRSRRAMWNESRRRFRSNLMSGR